MKRVLKTFNQKWPEYLIESIVIIASILGAYALDNWNEKRNERNQEQKILLQLKNEYQQNLQQLEQKIELRNFILNNCVKILEMMDDPENASSDQLTTSLRLILLGPTFDPISNDIIASGNIRLIDNTRLKELLQRWSSDIIQLQEEERKWDKIAVEQLLPMINKLGLTRFITSRSDINNSDNKKVRELILIDSTRTAVEITIPKPTVTLDVVPILQNKEFDGIVTSGIIFNRVANAQSFLLRDKINEIVKLIDTELKE